LKEAIRTDKAPPAVGPYSQGIRAGNLVFTSGQLPAKPTGELTSGDIAAATRQSLENVRAVLEAASAHMDDVIKVTIFLADMADFTTVNAAYEEFFTGVPPARSCVQVAALPKGAPIEIEAVAHLSQPG
jgi:2-iminobutanoate/2-iminopropanoate deaminase